ncbi:MAG: protein RarD [Marinosulfonomonas sp.]|nr:MAG: protein RarD [Marinosulfonomonas sp.]
MAEAKKGVLAMVIACIIWGLSPLYYKLIDHIDPLEVLSHRTLWSFVFFGTVLLFQRRFGEVFTLLGNWRDLLVVLFAALMISANWFLFIYSIQLERTVETSLGYYIFPLVAVVLGRVVFGERLSVVKWGAVVLATVAVVILTIGLGSPPWISLALAITFGLYGVIKKQTRAGSVVSVSGEVLLLAPVALIWLWGVHTQNWPGLVQAEGGVFTNNWRDSIILIFSGPVTATPLILFSYASKRIALASVGLIQYLNPTLQFFCAVVIFGEVFTPVHALAFPLIWLALAIYSFDAFRQERASSRALVNVATSSTEVT